MGHSAKDLKPGPRKCQIPISAERISTTNFGEIGPTRGSPFLREEMSGLWHSQSDTGIFQPEKLAVQNAKF